MREYSESKINHLVEWVVSGIKLRLRITIDEPGTDSKENISVLLVQLLISERVDSEWSAEKMERH